MSLGDRSLAHFPLWLELAGLPLQVNTVAGVAFAWSLFHRIVELDLEQNPLRPGYVDVGMPDLAGRCGLTSTQTVKGIRGLRKAGVLRAFLPDKDEWETVNALFQVITPIPVPTPAEAVREAHPTVFLGAEWPPRYAIGEQEEHDRTRLREARVSRAVELYLNQFSMKLNNIVLDQLQIIAERYEPHLIEKVFERARERDARSLSWVLTEIRREDRVRQEAERIREERRMKDEG